LVPVTGLEPVRHRWRRILSPESPLESSGNRWNLIENYESKKVHDTNAFSAFPVKKACRAPPFQISEK